MTEAAQTTEAPKRGRRRKPAPNAELAARREARKGRGVVDYGFNKRLGLDESKLDTDNYQYRWVNDDPGNINSLLSREWEIVEADDIEGQEAARMSGYRADGKPQNSVLMRKWKDWFDEDSREKLRLREENMAQIRKGQAAEQRSGDHDALVRAEDGNRIEAARARAVRNPDFE